MTKLLPAGDEATIRAVHNAVGDKFITRLLLPLRDQVEAPPVDVLLWIHTSVEKEVYDLSL